MKKRFPPLACAMTLGVLSTTAFAEVAWMETSVVYAGTYGNGDIYVIVTDTIPEPGCTAARFDVAASEPDAKNVLAIAYLAMLSGEKIRVDTNGCYNGYATLDNSGNSGLQLLGPGQ